MPDRAALISDFLDQVGWGGLPRTLVAGDASNRRYERVQRNAHSTAILMDAPPDKGEDVRPFVHITNHLRDVGLSAPEIYARDDTHGLLLIEDLGDDLFARVMAADTKLEDPLYAASVDVLVDLHQAECPNLPRYDADIMTDRASLAYDWYQRGVTGIVNTAERDAFVTAFHTCLTPLDSTPPVLIQRDYHAENLIWLPNREGVQKVGLLDYQDAMLGHPAYDLVSIVQDARRDVPAHVGEAMIAQYLNATHLDKEQFRCSYALLGAQRNLRILGIFARLSMLYGKPHYVDLIPRVWGHIQTNLSHPALSSIKPLIETTLPRAYSGKFAKAQRPMRHDPIALMLFAAGFGTRMKHLTAHQPKPLVKVAGRALIDHALALAHGVNAAPIVANLHYLPDMLEHHLSSTDVHTIRENRRS